jgi:hypothetical protein
MPARRCADFSGSKHSNPEKGFESPFRESSQLVHSREWPLEARMRRTKTPPHKCSMLPERCVRRHVLGVMIISMGTRWILVLAAPNLWGCLPSSGLGEREISGGQAAFLARLFRESSQLVHSWRVAAHPNANVQLKTSAKMFNASRTARKALVLAPIPIWNQQFRVA